MQALQELLKNYQGQIETIGAILIGLVVVFFGVKLTIKIISAFGNGKRDDGLKNLGWLVVVVIIGIAGWVGLRTLIQNIAPDSSILPRGGTASVLVPPREFIG